MSLYRYRYRCSDEAIYKFEDKLTDTFVPDFCVDDSDDSNGFVIESIAIGTGGGSFTNITATGHTFSNGNTVVVLRNDQITDGEYIVSSSAINNFDINFTFGGSNSTINGAVKRSYMIEATVSGSGGASFTQITIIGHPFSNGDILVVKNNVQITDGAYTVSSAGANTFDINFAFTSSSVTGYVTGFHSIILLSNTIVKFPENISNNLHVSGDLKLDGKIIFNVTEGQIAFPSGNSALPSITFQNDTDTGLSNDANQVVISTSGTAQVTVNGTNTTFANDMVVEGGRIDLTNISTGENQIRIPDDLSDAFSIQEGINKYMTFDTSNGTESIDLLKNTSIIGDLTVTGFVNTGSLSVQGNTTLEGDLRVCKKIYASLGTSVAPSITFKNDTDTGISAATQDTLVFSTNGVGRIITNTTSSIKNISTIMNAELTGVGNFTTETLTDETITFIGFNKLDGVINSSTTVINVPTNTTNGDVMIAHLCVRNGTEESFISTPASGWTLVENKHQPNGTVQHTIFVYYKVALNEPSSYTWSGITNGTNYIVGGIMTFRGVSNTGVLSTDINNDVSELNNSSVTTFPTKSLSVSKNNTMLVASFYYASTSDNWSIDNNMTRVYNSIPQTAPDVGGVSMTAGYAIQAINGISLVFTANANTDANIGITHILALNPKKVLSFGNTGTVPLTINQAIGGQDSDLVVINDSSGTKLASINGQGQYVLNGNSAVMSQKCDLYYVAETVAITANSTTWIEIPMTRIRFIDDNFSHNGTQGSITFNNSGVYEVTARCTVSLSGISSPQETAQIRLRLNNTSTIEGTVAFMSVGNNMNNTGTVVIIRHFNAGDSVSMQYHKNTTNAAENILLTTFGSSLTIRSV